MIKARAVLILFLSICAMQRGSAQCCPEQPRAEKKEILWQKLQDRIGQVDANLDGVLAVAIKDLTSGKEFLLHGDEIMPQASSIKIAVLADLFLQAQRGKLKLTEEYLLRKEDLVSGSDILLGLTPGVTRLSLRELATIMVAVSDNSATNILIGRLGMDDVNAMLANLGLKSTRLRRKMMDLNIKILSTHKESAMLQGLPDDAIAANKPGELEAVRNDSGIIFVKGRPYILCVMTTYLKDEKDGSAAIRRIAELTYSYFGRVARASEYGRVVSPK